MNYALPFVRCVLLVLFALSSVNSHAQWLTQTFRLKPGWNAVYLHVDASHADLDDLIPNAADPVAEIWLWQPTTVSMQYVDAPSQPTQVGSQWAVWTASRPDADTLRKLIGNAAYLVRNASATEVVWTVKGRPIPPSYSWTSTGLNLLGFSTPETAALPFDQFLAPAPGLDLGRSAANGAQVVGYTGGPLDAVNGNPKIISPLEARSKFVNRGEAFWVRANTNYFNTYYGPVSVILQNPSGMKFGEVSGAYSVRLKNLTSASRTVALNLAPSENPPAGQAAIAGTPQLLVRGERNLSDFTYAYSALSGNLFTLAPAGQPGSEQEVVIGLNRTAMTAPAGSLYAGVLRVTDSEGFSQIDVPVTASVAAMGGLWVGDANVGQVGQYLKTYPKVLATSAAPRASFLDLDGTTGFGTFPAGIPVQTGSFTVEAWVNLRAPVDSMPLASLQVVPAANTNLDSTALAFHLTATGGRLNPNISVPLLLDQGPLPADGRSLTGVVPLTRDFGGTNSIGGQTISFDLTIAGTGDNWAGLVLGAAEPSKGVNINGADGHFGVLFRASGKLQAFDGATAVTGVEPTWTANNPTLAQHHFDVVCTDPNDGNPFDGAGATKVEVYVDGGAAPVFSFTKSAGGYAQNFVNFQALSLSSMKVRNLAVGGLARQIVSAVAIAPGNWTHVAMVGAGGVGKIYVNGSKAAEGALPPSFSGIATNGGIGFSPRAVGFANAGIDDFRLWSIARSESDIRKDMAAGRLAKNTPGLQAQYDFPATGDLGEDSSGNDSDLALQGAAVRGTATLSAADATAANVAVYVAAANRAQEGSEIPGSDWVNRTPDTARGYSAIASSQNGSRLIATALGAGGGLYISSDAGATWSVSTPDGVNTWVGVASSGNGATLAAVASGRQIYTSSDAGATWTARETARAWAAVALSADGTRMVAPVSGGKIYTSSNSGATWTERDTLRNWSAVASSADGSRLVATVTGGNIYASTDYGATWTARETARTWTDVSSSADGMNLAATVNTAATGGQIYTSTDGGATWTPRETNRSWTGIASSTDGSRLLAVASGVGIFNSTDGGVSWTQQEIGRTWRAVSISGDASQAAAVVDGGAVYTKSRVFANYTLDAASGLIRAQDGSYISTGVNTNLASTPSPFPLRLILQGDTTANNVKLLQHVFVGKGAVSSNLIVASSEDLLDASQIASARRISAAHLPFTAENLFWTATGQVVQGTALSFTVPVDYNDQQSNPFLHTFHPDHDNLSSDFKRVEALGVESYGITRQIRLTFSPPGNDFASLTASGLSLNGLYEETITLQGRAGASRQFRMAGAFTVRRLSPITTLTTQ